MKIKIFIHSGILAGLIVLSGGVSAVPYKNSPGANGVPFQLLQEQIDDIQEQIGNIQDQIDDINTQIAELSAQVDDNADMIGMLESDVAALEALVTKLEAFRDRVALGCPDGHAIQSVASDGSSIRCERMMDSGISIRTTTRFIYPNQSMSVQALCPLNSYLLRNRVVEILGPSPKSSSRRPAGSGLKRDWLGIRSAGSQNLQFTGDFKHYL